MPTRTVFVISDHTGITAESVARSLLAHFEGVTFEYQARPFTDTEAEIEAIVSEVRLVHQVQGLRPIIFSTLTNPALSALLEQAPALVFDLFGPYLGVLEAELGARVQPRVGRFHSINDAGAYFTRIDAVDFVLATDDGLGGKHYAQAEVILVGVSRAGKTPTCLFLGLQYGIRAANYPLAEDDFERLTLPEPLQPYRAKVFGLTIDPLHLQKIRTARKPGSRYATLEQCRYEVERAELLFKNNGIRYFDTTTSSIEEIATTIVQNAGLSRRLR